MQTPPGWGNLKVSLLFRPGAVIPLRTPPKTPRMVLDKYQKKLCIYAYYYYL
jgi:hypothetical protein